MDKEIIKNELLFQAVRSSGPGGQHVNKVSSKVILSFDLANSAGLSESEKERLKEKLSSKLTKEHILILSCGESRSQHKNKALVMAKFFKELQRNLTEQKKRELTRPSKTSIEKRLEKKKQHALKKALRQKLKD